jgi:hypothetical protein
VGGPGEDGVLHPPRAAGRDEAGPGHRRHRTDDRLNTGTGGNNSWSDIYKKRNIGLFISTLCFSVSDPRSRSGLDWIRIQSG